MRGKLGLCGGVRQPVRVGGHARFGWFGRRAQGIRGHDDRCARVSVPSDDDGNPLTGYTVVNVGLPTLTVIEGAYGGLTSAQRPPRSVAPETT